MSLLYLESNFHGRKKINLSCSGSIFFFHPREHCVSQGQKCLLNLPSHFKEMNGRGNSQRQFMGSQNSSAVCERIISRVFVCVCVYGVVCVHVWAFTHVSKHEYGVQRLIPHYSSITVLVAFGGRTSQYICSSSIHIGWPASPRDPSGFASTVPALAAQTTTIGIFKWVLGLKHGHSCLHGPFFRNYLNKIAHHNNPARQDTIPKCCW